MVDIFCELKLYELESRLTSRNITVVRNYKKEAKTTKQLVVVVYKGTILTLTFNLQIF